MSHLTNISLLLFLAFLHQAHSQTLFLNETIRRRGSQCPGNCRFQLCGKSDGTFLGVPNVIFGARICRRKQLIGKILSVAQARVFVTKKNTVPISKWMPAGLNTRFPRKYFTVADAPVTRGKSVIVRKTSKGNQNEFVDKQCFQLPIKTYEQFQDGVAVTVNSKGDRKSCVAFRARAPDVSIQVIWFSGDDLDLKVEEPDGTLVTSDPDFRTSQCGRHGGNGGIDACNLFLGARERVDYDRKCDKFQRGKYKVTISHSTNCGALNGGPVGKTRWDASLTIGGVTTMKRTGESDRDRGEIISQFEYTL